MKISPQTTLQNILGIVLLGLVGFLGFSYNNTSRNLSSLQEEFASSTADFQIRLSDAVRQSEELAASLEAERTKNADLEKDKRRAENKVDELEELSELDPELLQKYSKVYFLNENYSPSGLEKIKSEYLLYPDKEQQIHDDVEKYLYRMLDGAEDDNLLIKVASAFRSFEEQTSLKSNYSTTYGSGANKFSADQGYSEHQLGTTVDLTTPAGGLTTAFAQTAEYAWLKENAYRYGFVLSYPEGNRYYIFEPWHWRFVGIDLARKLHRDNKNFYDMDQRDIDRYLGDIFN